VSDLRPTEKLYYQDVLARKADARIARVEGNKVILDRTLFYAEGGGQIGDIGCIGPVAIIDTQKQGGQLVIKRGLPQVNVGTEVVHFAAADVSAVFAPGDRVEIEIDDRHRTGCMRHHGATHLAMCQIWQRLGRDAFVTKGCWIGPQEARLDMFTEHRLGAELIAEIEAGVNAWIQTDEAIEMRPVPDVPEMFIWNCALNEVLSMPCGGTHPPRLGGIGRVRLQRRSKGKKLERIYIYVTE